MFTVDLKYFEIPLTIRSNLIFDFHLSNKKLEAGFI